MNVNMSVEVYESPHHCHRDQKHLCRCSTEQSTSDRWSWVTTRLIFISDINLKHLGLLFHQTKSFHFYLGRSEVWFQVSTCQNVNVFEQDTDLHSRPLHIDPDTVISVWLRGKSCLYSVKIIERTVGTKEWETCCESTLD